MSIIYIATFDLVMRKKSNSKIDLSICLKTSQIISEKGIRVSVKVTTWLKSSSDSYSNYIFIIRLSEMLKICCLVVEAKITVWKMI